MSVPSFSLLPGSSRRTPISPLRCLAFTGKDRVAAPTACSSPPLGHSPLLSTATPAARLHANSARFCQQPTSHGHSASVSPPLLLSAVSYVKMEIGQQDGNEEPCPARVVSLSSSRWSVVTVLGCREPSDRSSDRVAIRRRVQLITVHDATEWNSGGRNESPQIFPVEDPLTN